MSNEGRNKYILNDLEIFGHNCEPSYKSPSSITWTWWGASEEQGTMQIVNEPVCAKKTQPGAHVFLPTNCG